jgi:hypothetical protein
MYIKHGYDDDTAWCDTMKKTDHGFDDDTAWYNPKDQSWQ